MGQPTKFPVRTTEKKEFWKPERPTLLRAKRCDGCGNELFIGSRYCHLCGTGPELERPRNISSAADRQTGTWDWRKLTAATGLAPAPLICGVVALVCTLAAIVTGFIYTANTALDWQAIQMWRIEWMLAALVALLAGVLLKRR